MVAKTVLFVCAQALLLQSIAAQCFGAPLAAPLAAAPWGAPCGAAPWGAAPWGTAPFCAAGIYGPETLSPAAASASYGGGLPVASASAIPPTGVSVTSDNGYAGELAVRGALPFLGTVSLEGALPTAGAGGIDFGCGNGAVAIVSEDIGGIAGPLAYDAAIGPLGYRGDAFGYGIGPLGYDAAIARPYARAGCGCGRAAFI